jgi:hypothetical protein
MEIKFEDGELGSLRQRGEELIMKNPAVHPPVSEMQKDEIKKHRARPYLLPSTFSNSMAPPIAPPPSLDRSDDSGV